LFNFKKENFEIGATIFSDNEVTKAMFIIKSGVVEITAKIDNEELAIERLYTGSIMNHRSFLLMDALDVSAKCSTEVTLYYLSFD